MTDRADLVVVGAGTIGGWSSVFAAAEGVGRVVVLDRGAAGMGASSRAAGIVRAQGGTPETVALGRWSIDFYRGQAAAYGTDSGFREHGYLILAVTEEDERSRSCPRRDAARRGPRQTSLAGARRGGRGPSRTLATSGHRGGSFRSADGHVDPPRNVRAYGLAMQRAGVELREGVTFTGLRTTADGRPRHGRRDRRRCHRDRAGPADRWSVACAAVGERAGLRIPVGAARHTVAVLEPHDGGRRAASDGLRPRAPGCTGVWRRAACCSAGAIPTTSRARPARSTGTPTPATATVWPGSCRSPATSACAGSGRRPSTTRPTMCRSSGRRSGRTGRAIDGVVGRRRRRSRDDVGTGHRPRRGRPRSCVARPTSSTSRTSAWIASTTTAAAGWRPTRSPCRSRSASD